MGRLALRAMLAGRETETAALTRLIADARDGVSGVIVLEGEAGIGKTALLGFAESSGAGMQIAHATGVQPEMDIPYSGLHQLLSPFLDGLERIPDPHAEALRSAFGLTSAPARDRFFVGMAALAVLSDAAMRRPVLCLIDDADRLDRASVDALGFTARRLVADRLAMVFAVRDEENRQSVLEGLPRMSLSGLDPEAALELLAAVAGASVADAVAARIVEEAHGHPLAIIGIAGELSREQFEGRAALPEPLPLTGRLEDLAVTKLGELPPDLRTLFLLAAADRSGDPGLIWRAAERLGIRRDSTDTSRLEHCFSFTPRVRFHHPLIRSSGYYAASERERREAHRALAAASDPECDSHHRAWHLAAAADQPDEEIARDLERAADRARGRGGWASAANFLDRAAELSPDDSARAERTLASAHAWLLAGQPGAAQSALDEAVPALADPVSRCRAARLGGMIDFTLGRPADASAALLTAATMYAAHDARAARDIVLEAFDAAHLAGTFADVGVAKVLEVAHALPPSGGSPTVADALLGGFATLLQSGDPAGVPMIRQTLESLSFDQPPTDEEVSWLPIAWIAAPELFDDRIWQSLTSRWAMAARMHGTVIALPIGLGRMPHFDVVVGRFAAAERMVAEARDLAAATESAARPGGLGTVELSALAWRGREEDARIAAATLIPELTNLSRGIGIRMVHLAMTVLELGLGNYREALRAARKACADDQLIHLNAAPEVIEAAVRCGELDVARAALDRLRVRAEASGADWGLGLMLRSQALLAEREEAEDLYRAAIEHLSRTLVLPQLGRTHLLYGEWLRRQRRRRDARVELRAAFELLGDLGVDAFAERARAELLATGEHARKRTVETRDQLTPQEEQIARLASEGASNMDIATQLFISVPTVVYHLQKAFRKLDITRRTSLARALAEQNRRQVEGAESALDAGPETRARLRSGT